MTANPNAGHDQSHVTTLAALSSADGVTIVPLYANPTTNRLLVDNALSSGIASINSDTTSAQVLLVGSTGTDFAIVDDLAGNHTFNLPNASATARGVITTGTQTIAGAKTFSSTIAGSISGNAATATTLVTGRTLAITGDLTWTSPTFDGSGNVTAAGTLATVNGNVGSFGSATQSVALTVNGKGLVTAASATTITPAVGSITGLGTGIATFLATPSSANLATAVTDETGSGALVFATSPTLVTPTLGAAIATSLQANTLTATTNNSINLGSGSYNTIQTYTPTAAGTATLDLSKGNYHRITMPAGNVTVAISNGTAGQCFILDITQDGTGSRTVTWFSGIKWAGGGAPTLTTTASKIDTLGFTVTTAGSAYQGYIVGQNL